MTAAELDRVRKHVEATIRHATDLLGALTSLDESLQILLPSLARMTEAEREVYVAHLCGYDEALPAPGSLTTSRASRPAKKTPPDARPCRPSCGRRTT